ncbi:hypothetical protein [Pseudodesulfovibrio tunisiensis]|uniref:hypothetical protein n=1 Tax=Pseudodesulfovibrio tunisiensis TaxID=463192 RepID=UPI001FB1A54D|nr:hypothetical protein [Pseudodesulfovibrio tunisiensis]
MKNYDKLLEGLRELAIREYGSVTAMATSIDFSQSTLSKMMNRKSCPRIDTICELFDKLGIGFTFPGEAKEGPQYRTPEAALLDAHIADLRAKKAPEEAIKDFALKALKIEFEKNEQAEPKQERRQAI